MNDSDQSKAGISKKPGTSLNYRLGESKLHLKNKPKRRKDGWISSESIMRIGMTGLYKIIPVIKKHINISTKARIKNKCAVIQYSHCIHFYKKDDINSSELNLREQNVKLSISQN